MKVVMGGSFDPVHVGHLRIATELAEHLGVSVDLMPCQQAVHKASQSARADHRLAMLRLAIKGNDSLGIDERELNRTCDSYTITSLQALRAECGDEPVIFVMGSDSAATLATWKEAERFAALANFLILTRPGQDQGAALGTYRPCLEMLGLRYATSVDSLTQTSSGLFFELPLSALEISSSDIRRRVREKHSIRYIVTDAVARYICDNSLYLGD